MSYRYNKIWPDKRTNERTRRMDSPKITPSPTLSGGECIEIYDTIPYDTIR